MVLQPDSERGDSMFANDMRPDFCIRHTRKENASGAVKEMYSRLPQQVMVPGRSS